MKSLFNITAFETSKLTTLRYSTSFSLGIKTLHKRLRYPIYAIYGYVRFGDEIVDTFHDQDKAALLEEFRRDTFQAIERGHSMNPILHAFQAVVNEYQIDHSLITAFLDSMALDLNHDSHDLEGYKSYIYGSAEVVGLMCLKVFVDGDPQAYDSLKDNAISLGAAFQKVNFLRDIKSDFEERGRVYFPGVDFEEFTVKEKLEIEEDIIKDFDHAFRGIVRLPKSARAGVYLAYIYYRKLFRKIQRSSPSQLQNKRLRIPDGRKLSLLVSSYCRERMGSLSRI